MACSTQATHTLRNFFLTKIQDPTDIVYNIFDNSCNFQEILNSLLWKAESTEDKGIRTRCFAIGIFAFHLDLDTDIQKLPISPSIICDIRNLRRTGLVTYNLMHFNRYYGMDVVLLSFLNRVGGLKTICVHGTDFEFRTEEDKVLIQRGLEEYRLAQMNALFSSEIFAPENRYAFRSYGNWLVHAQKTDLLAMISPYQHLFFDYVEEYGGMFLAIQSAATNPKMFQCLYAKGIRKTVSVDNWNCRVQIDTYDGGIPYDLIESKASDALMWYISQRKKEDPTFTKSCIEILSWYYEISKNFHGEYDSMTNVLMKMMSEERINRYKEELIRVTWHPKRVQWWMDHEEYSEVFQCH